MKNEELTQLLIYLITSAAGLPGEPKAYGPLRLVESAQRLSAILLKDDPDNETLKALLQLINENKHKNMTDPDAFYAMLDEAAGMSVDLM